MAEQVATLPDVHRGVRLLVAGKTVAEDRVETAFVRMPQSPYTRFQREGGPRPSVDRRIDRARIVFFCYGRNRGEAYRSAMQLRSVFFPPERVVHGYRGWCDPVSPGGPGDCWIDNVEPDTGPDWSPDSDTGEARYRIGFLVTYW